MTDKYLFLFGANPSLEEANELFIQKSGGQNAKIVLLIMNRSGWEEYLPRYTDVWKRNGVVHISVILPDDNGELNEKIAEELLQEATGIFIGGGDTEKYHAYYAMEPIKSILKDCYSKGVPIAGSSAGALILPEICLISPKDSSNGEMLSKAGIGLLSDILIGVHFTEWNDKVNLLEGMKNHKIRYGIGIDEEACALFKNGKFESEFGEYVHHIEIND
ncbi:cyanophycinase [Paenibacillus antarcticus]|uniref:Peptidase S51 n=1 Tax=Paenibacillus antarcticus TaxID=253703 RepID=A0A162K472_9BACL|nr:cyanophycinase [Paenibacillus antarcticus]OAB42766.1 peptidase S51 [Paenibacillus antarcticus]